MATMCYPYRSARICHPHPPTVHVHEKSLDESPIIFQRAGNLACADTPQPSRRLDKTRNDLHETRNLPGKKPTKISETESIPAEQCADNFLAIPEATDIRRILR